MESMDVDNVSCAVVSAPNSYAYSRSNSTACSPAVGGSKCAPCHAEAKQFLISYVRAEAACAAKVLKYALEQRGYSVYLVRSHLVTGWLKSSHVHVKATPFCQDSWALPSYLLQAT